MSKENIKLFKQGKYKDLMLKINEKHDTNKNKTRLQKNAYSTLKNNEFGIINQKHEFNVGTFAESNISILKSLFGYGAKCFNLKTYQNMINLRLSQINGLKVLDLIIKTEINFKEKETLNYYRNSIWKKYKTDFNYQYEFPLLNSTAQKSKFIKGFLNS